MVEGEMDIKFQTIPIPNDSGSGSAGHFPKNKKAPELAPEALKKSANFSARDSEWHWYYLTFFVPPLP